MTGTLANPGIGTLDPSDPALRYVDLTTVHISEAQRMDLPAWARAVVPGPAGAPLLYSGTLAGRPAAVLAFEPRRSDLPLQVAFPILLANLAGELLGGSETPLDAIVPGAPVTLAIPDGAIGVRVQRPDGTTDDLMAPTKDAASVTFARTGLLGVYTVTGIPDPETAPAVVTPTPGPSASAGSSASAGTASPGPTPGASPTLRPADPDAPARFAVDLLDVDESNIAPGDIAALAALGQPGTSPVPGASSDAGAGAGAGTTVPRRAARRPRRAVDPHRPGRPARAHPRVARVRARHARPPPARRRRPGPPHAARGAGCLMGISFDAPLALLLLPPLLAVVIALHLSSRRRLGVGRRRAALVVRVLLLTVLVSALAGLQLVLPVDRLAVVFVVDLSDSVGTAGREEALAYVRGSLAAKPDEDVAGIVAFGGDALVERLPSELAEIDRIASTPVTSATDVGAALRLAAAMFPDDAQKRIVLLSDGNDTTGSGQTEASLAAARGIRVETVLTGLNGGDEVIVERLTGPSTARLGEEIEVTGDITSTVAQPATVRLFVNGELARTQPVELVMGPNRVTFTFTPRDPGFLRFRIVVEAGRDTFSQNDRADANTIVKGEPRVLVVKGDEDVAAQLVAALKTERQLVDTVIPEALPSDLAGLAEYDSSCWWTFPASGSPTPRSPRSRSTSGTSAGAW